LAKVYQINCRDIGVDCDFEARAPSLEDVLELCADHGRREHGLKGFGHELYSKMRPHIHTSEEQGPSRGS